MKNLALAVLLAMLSLPALAGEEAPEGESPCLSGGGGVFMNFLYTKYRSPYGDFTGWTTYIGGRGHVALWKGRIRIGVAGAGGQGSDEAFWLTSVEAYPSSVERGIEANYGGLTLQYALRFGRYIEIPLGFLVGYGVGGYRAELARDSSHDVTTTHESRDQFLAFQVLAGFDLNVLSWMRLSLMATYLHADPFGETENLGGIGLQAGLSLGRFWP